MRGLAWGNATLLLVPLVALAWRWRDKLGVVLELWLRWRWPRSSSLASARLAASARGDIERPARRRWRPPRSSSCRGRQSGSTDSLPTPTSCESRSISTRRTASQLPRYWPGLGSTPPLRAWRRRTWSGHRGHRALRGSTRCGRGLYRAGRSSGDSRARRSCGSTTTRSSSSHWRSLGHDSPASGWSFPLFYVTHRLPRELLGASSLEPGGSAWPKPDDVPMASWVFNHAPPAEWPAIGHAALAVAVVVAICWSAAPAHRRSR